MPHFPLLNHACPLANIITSRGKSWIIGKLDKWLFWVVFRKKDGKAPPFIKHFNLIFTALSLGTKFFANRIQNCLIDNLATSYIQPIRQMRIIVERSNIFVSQRQHMRQGCVIQSFG